MFIADKWQDYEVLDCGGGEKLERWGDVYLRRPDPQAIWPARDPSLWRKAQAHYHRSEKGGGNWEFFDKLGPCLFYYLKLLLWLPAEQPQGCHSGELGSCEGRQPAEPDRSH